MSLCNLMLGLHCRRGQAAFGVRRSSVSVVTASGFDTCCRHLFFFWLSCPWTRQIYRIEGLQQSECRVTVVSMSPPYNRSWRVADNIPWLCKLAAFRCGVVETFILLGCWADRLVFGYRRFGTIYLSQLQGSSGLPSLFLYILLHFLSFFLIFCPFVLFPFLIIFSRSIF